MRRDSRLEEIEAHLVVLSADGAVEETIVAGETVYVSQ